jgi:O-antigen ligase
VILKSKYRLLGVALIAGTLFAAEFILTSVVSERMTERYETLFNLEEDRSAQSRLWNWEFCRRVGVDRPLFGAGFNFYSLDAYARYYPEFLQQFPGELWSCHNTLLSVFAEHGMIGLGLWAGLVVSCILSLNKIQRYSLQHTELAAFAQWTAMLRLGFYAFIIVGMFVDFAYYEVFYQLVGVVILMKNRTIENLKV